MASRSSTSTHSKRSSMTAPSARSRSERPSKDGQPKDAPAMRGPSEKKHKNMEEVQLTGRQSDQGGKPGGTRKASGRR
ncbi:MAG TPA: hypothetical protein VGD76_09035 [Ramlibacter sp.]